MKPEHCPACGSEVPRGLSICPICGISFSAATGRFTTNGESIPTGSLAIGSGDPAHQNRSGLAAGAASIGALLLGVVTKGGAFLSMLAAFGVYWTLWGWRFAAGFVLSIWIHEMGHVLALRKEGIPATAPMFIPGLGAFVRLKELPKDARQDARIGLAGPMAGLLAAIACAGLSMTTGHPIFAALTAAGAMINLFNLLPVWQLDGSRGIHPLGAGERLVIAAGFAIAAWTTKEKLFYLFAVAAGARAFRVEKEATGDSGTLVTFLGILAALTALLVLYPMRSG